MNLFLARFQFSDKTTIGRMNVDGMFECYTLEDVDRHMEDDLANKVYGQTAIPRGKYKVIVDYSARFEKELPRVLDVPGFKGIRIHPGNTHEDTEGCILVGSNYKDNFVGNSRATFAHLMDQLEAAYSDGEDIWLEVA